MLHRTTVFLLLALLAAGVSWSEDEGLAPAEALKRLGGIKVASTEKADVAKAAETASAAADAFMMERIVSSLAVPICETRF